MPYGTRARVPFDPTLFGLYVDALKKHLLYTDGIDAPTLHIGRC